ncbi:hypothetical protein M378DRAFT_157639 [Amanita muscaria Koide BX008]|uniref:Uncharacterized protein n=1 Tax=Amanita muscaria (strain Koide BX008) TaxID=946122 RepID=A0A0C2XIS0_AMAMK|nr:hypothetical protein M378DRAFT_157639 [Amanita muscaria Koide BX008]
MVIENFERGPSYRTNAAATRKAYSGSAQFMSRICYKGIRWMFETCNLTLDVAIDRGLFSLIVQWRA